MYKDFKLSYYNRTGHEDWVKPLFDIKTWLENYPIICIDCSRKPDSVLKDSLINMKIKIEWGTPLPDNTVVHCVVISNAKVKYSPLHGIAVI